MAKVDSFPLNVILSWRSGIVINKVALVGKDPETVQALSRPSTISKSIPELVSGRSAFLCCNKTLRLENDNKANM